MRTTTNPPKPSTNTLKALPLNVGANSRNYPDLIRGTFNNYTADTVELTPEAGGSGKDYTRINFELGLESRELKLTDAWILDLTETAIDLITKTGGIIDGITKEDGRSYLIWFFLDQNFNFSGIGLTRKPYSTFTSGSAYLQGDTGTFTVTNGYQFTIGSRVCVRNQEGSVPFYEWNWGFVQTVDNTTLTVLLDNEAYGTTINITAANGEILQWDKFRPYVVTTTDQTLYDSYYSLFGEVETDLSSGDIFPANRKDNPHRTMDSVTNQNRIHTGNATATDVVTYLGRIIPLWSDSIDILGVHRTSDLSSSNLFQVKKKVNIEQYQAVTQAANIISRSHGTVGVDVNGSVTLDFTTATITVNNIYLSGYYTPGGMRL